MSRLLSALALLALVCACVIDPIGPSGARSSPGSSGIAIALPPVKPPPPTLTAISPSSAAPGTSVTVVLTGTNFQQNGTNVTIDGSGVSIVAFSVTSATEMTASVTVAFSATAGAHQMKLTTSGGTSETKTFEVTQTSSGLPRSQ